MTGFKTDSPGLTKRLRKSGRSLFLTVGGKAEAVLHREVAAHLDSVASIRRGLDQAKNGSGRPARQVFDELEREA